ncbi:spindle pole body protein [Thelephora terrestris]|uniref:Spindle pole body protein n=1 Tax=Thelephora terrestris TaxID=56493 RepID=A0A9P6HGZ5_9AGAM|nr:spindle pole body protein [Thelephora terrestris]
MASRKVGSDQEHGSGVVDDRPAKRARVEALDSEEEDNSAPQVAPQASDLYLDTINRAKLDFDFEKVCSVSLSNINIYGCLVCGKYFQGRGRSSYAYAHSIHEDHHVFINLESTKVYVLPDGYLVNDPSLEDIAYVLSPKFTKAYVQQLSSKSTPLKTSYDLTQNSYLPGFIGLNNIKKNDHMNVIIHALLHVPPLRDYLLLGSFKGKETELVKRFAALAKKLWNPRLFKSQVSPHEFLQEVGRESARNFTLEKQGDPAEFLGWLLNTLHRHMGGTRKKNSSIIFSTFQGHLRQEQQQIVVRPDTDTDAKPQFDIDREVKTTATPFLFLAVDLPPPPLFQDAVEKNIIPQVSIYSILAKFDGVTAQGNAGILKRYKCQQLPPYIILNFKRFTKNIFVEEKNPTIVNFPLRGLDFREYLDAPPNHPPTAYDLIANVTHESTAGTTRDKENTVYKVHLRASGTDDDWYQIQDLIVEKTRKEMIFLGETVLQVWERRDVTSKEEMDVDR